MLVGPPSQRPPVPPVGLADRQIVDARDPPPHEAAGIELPVLVPVGAEPLAAVVAPLVGEPDRDPVLVKRPQLLDEPVLQLAGPLPGEELDDRVPAGEELGAVAPDAVHRVAGRDLRGIAAVPRVLGEPDLPGRAVAVVGRQRRAAPLRGPAGWRSPNPLVPRGPPLSASSAWPAGRPASHPPPCHPSP